MLKLENITFSFSKNILNNINIEIPDNNQLILLLGPNGAGKTTLLNLIGSYYQKYTGTLTKKGEFFLLPDYEYIPDKLTILECIKYFPNLYKNFNIERAKNMLKNLNLSLDKPINSFSKGMKEQIHIVMALAQDVDTYLFDEPLAAVDPINRELFINLINDYRSKDSNVILSTHLVKDMDNIFDEVIFISNGKILLYDNKKNLFTNKDINLEKKYMEIIKSGNVNKINI